MSSVAWAKKLFASQQGENRKTATSLGAGTYYTKPMTIGDASRIAAHFKFGNTTATIRLQTSCDQDAKRDAEGASAGAGNWVDEALTPPSDPAGSAGQIMWHISDVNAQLARFKIVVSSGTSDWLGWIHMKE